MSEIHGAVGSYVVHALDGVELEEFEAHLAVCETCQREVLEFSETAAELSRLTEATPPAALRSSLLSAIAEVRPLPPELPAQPAVDELAVRRQRRATRLLAFAVAAALVVALALGGWVVNLVQTRQAQVASTTLQTQVLTAPDAQVHATTMRDGSHVSFVASRSLNKAYLIGSDVPATGPDRTYQLWTLNAAGAHPDNTFAGGSQTTAWFSGDISGAAGLAVTIEPRSGSQTPTLPIQASTKL